MSEESEPKPWHETLDFTSDSVRLLENGQRVKCMVIMDVTSLDPEQRKDFMNRCLVSLTRMGQKVLTRKDQKN